MSGGFMFRVLLASALLAGIFIGCQRENGPTVPIDTVYRLSLTAEPDTISDNPSSYSTITATLIDQSGHPVGRGVPVNFTANFGTIASTAFTDDNGRAATLFLPDRTLGMVKITASMPTVDKLPVEDDVRVCVVDAGMPVSIRLTAAPPLISVRGVGGTETSALTAEVLNAIGEPVDEEKTVIIDLLREPPLPQGGQIDGHGQRDSTRTVEGIARAGLNAGTQIGAKLVRVYTWRDNNRRDTVSVTASPVAVISGPPFQLDVDVNDKAVNAGGGAWICEVSARVWDIHRNPVANNIPVVFTVDPQIATISAGLTGNRSRAWNSIPGVAFADLIYHSVNTFDEITISAEVHTTGGMITGTREHKLPLQ
ncbi:MAG: hypothetical protein FJY65_01490, partial [Calditrichaeota bacterium]|nr:hypothetical protein [Calditrichota bacterium]